MVFKCQKESTHWLGTEENSLKREKQNRLESYLNQEKSPVIPSSPLFFFLPPLFLSSTASHYQLHYSSISQHDFPHPLAWPAIPSLSCLWSYSPYRKGSPHLPRVLPAAGDEEAPFQCHQKTKGPRLLKGGSTDMLILYHKFIFGKNGLKIYRKKTSKFYKLVLSWSILKYFKIHALFHKSNNYLLKWSFTW